MNDAEKKFEKYFLIYQKIIQGILDSESNKENLILEYYHVGSTYVLKNKEKCKDIDFLVRVSSLELIEIVMKSNPDFEPGWLDNDPEFGSDPSDYDEMPLKSYKLMPNSLGMSSSGYPLNLIFVDNLSYFNAFMYATKLQLHFPFRIYNKEERCKLHEIILAHHYEYNRQQTEPLLFDFVEFPESEIEKDTENFDSGKIDELIKNFNTSPMKKKK